MQWFTSDLHLAHPRRHRGLNVAMESHSNTYLYERRP